jgi:hypothetical protein
MYVLETCVVLFAGCVCLYYHPAVSKVYGFVWDKVYQAVVDEKVYNGLSDNVVEPQPSFVMSVRNYLCCYE